MGNGQTNKNTKTIYGYPIYNFYLMPRNTNINLIIKAMSEIYTESDSDITFSGSSENCYGLPYMELIIPNSSGTYYVYSTTNTDNYLFTTDSSKLVLENKNIETNSFRFYMWNNTIFNLSVTPTEEFPITKTFSFKNVNNNIVQTMELKATVTPTNNQSNSYTISTVKRNTIYIYYPSTIIYCLVDSINKKIYVMQSGNNQKSSNNKLTPENMVNIETSLNLPEGYLFLTCQIPNNETLVVLSTPKKPAEIIEDDLGNTYQLADKNYSKFLYSNFT